MVKIIECPRDAMQGIQAFIPTKVKVEYLNQLLQVGFNTIDIGSFVSPKAIPQMRDTAQMLKQLNLADKKGLLSVIVANERGANDAVQFDEVDILGYPFSISETFQHRNTNSSIEESLDKVSYIQSKCIKHDKELLIYISMGFGNPYGDEWNVEICQKWVDQLAAMGIKTMALSDTIGVATPDSISYLFTNLIPPYPDVEFGAHLHTHKHNWEEKIAAAYMSGCKRYDGAIRGFGGCPMAKDDLTGNMPTENLVSYINEQIGEEIIDMKSFNEAISIADRLFTEFH